ncbi:hypothetical protein LWI28_002176 [Acer negundo]|uniref:DDE Tnp4 domain-containing protein n=1 Tax=Acer negundo TaxID=4023 RepID=A0AAD5JS84_ACENE|nr:hypothetical protein LWI28_002176 [Acer negundo]
MYGENELQEDEIEGEEIDEEETDGEDMDVKEFEEDEEFYKIIKHLLMAIQVVVHVLNEFMVVMSEQHVERKYYLVDCGFPNRRQFLAPFRGVRYHLQEFGGQERDLANEVELFNLRHASLMNVIEKIFGIFKSRFTIFKTAPPFLFRTQTDLVSACVGLHNFLRKECRSDEFPIEQDNEVDPESIFQTQEQQRTEANEWRDDIAWNMWMDANTMITMRINEDEL